jgi:hypothetical protein
MKVLIGAVAVVLLMIGARITINVHIICLSPYRTVSLYLGRSIFDNIYNLAYRISIHNVISDIIMLDVLKNPMLSDVLNVLHVNGICILILINELLLSLDIIY